MRILFLTRWFPYPADNGSKLRIWNLLRGLGTQHDVTLLSFVDGDRDPDISVFQGVSRDVHTIPWREFDPGSRQARLGLLSWWPRSHVDTYSQAMGARIEEMIARENYDLVIASQSQMASYGNCFGGTPALLEEVELGVLYDQFALAKAVQERLRYGLTWAKHRYYLSRALQNFQACTVVSEQERSLFAASIPQYRNVTVIPNCIDLASYEGIENEPEAGSLVFTGSFRYSPNFDAMNWFVEQILPRIRDEVPEVRLTITGDPADLKLPRTPGVTQTGLVPDVRPYVASAWASVVPLRIGGGTRLKILEAMAMRTPVVTTNKGAEGLELIHEHSALIADSEDEFAVAVVRLFSEIGLREKLAANAYQLVHEKYDWASVMPRFLRLVDSTILEAQVR